jgi:hypothetical protein
MSATDRALSAASRGCTGEPKSRASGLDWRVRRAEYLIETGRADQVKTEGLEHELFGKLLGAARASAVGDE